MLRRILLFIGITLVAMLLIIMIATRTILLAGFSRLEMSFLEKNMARAQNAISDEIDSLGMTASHLAERNDAYQFVQDRDHDYIESNLTGAMFSSLHLDVVLYRDRTGGAVFGAAFDPAEGLREIPASLREWLVAHPSLARPVVGSPQSEGIIPLPAGPLMAAVRPILDSQRAGPARGTLLVGRFLDDNEVNRLARSLRLSISLSPLGNRSVPAVPSGQSPAGNLVSVDASREDLIAGSGVLRDMTGSPAFLLTVRIPRDIHHQGEAILRYFILWLVVAGAVFGGVVLIVIQRTVLARLQRLSAGVLDIGTAGGPGHRVPVIGRDQIAYLGAAINGMLDALEGSHGQLQRSEQRNKAFLDAIPDLILRVGRGGEIIDARFPPRSGFADRQDAFVRSTIDGVARQFPFVPQKLLSAGSSAIAQALDSGLPVVLEFSIDAGKGLQYYQARIVASGDAEVIVLVREVTAEKRVEEAGRRETLVKEIHHRVKNNLQVISSLLGLQASAARDAHARAMLEESRGRVRSMALVHDRLYQASGGGYADYVRDLARHLLYSYFGDSPAVTIKVEIDDLPMDMDRSVPVGLIINELLSNALAHAFPKGGPGRITVGMRRVDGGLLELAVSDDGIGFPENLDYRNPASLGLRIVNTLVQQIQGTLTLDAGRGTSFLVTFPES
jgi:two-component sensor histidine kinase/sensor domain CHASE-containing protein